MNSPHRRAGGTPGCAGSQTKRDQTAIITGRIMGLRLVFL